MAVIHANKIKVKSSARINAEDTSMVVTIFGLKNRDLIINENEISYHEIELAAEKDADEPERDDIVTDEPNESEVEEIEV